MFDFGGAHEEEGHGRALLLSDQTGEPIDGQGEHRGQD
jgi:hypothetical protein